MTTSSQTELLTVKEVASQLYLDDTTVRRRIKNGKIPAIHLPRTPQGKRNEYRIKRETLNTLMGEKA